MNEKHDPVLEIYQLPPAMGAMVERRVVPLVRMYRPHEPLMRLLKMIYVQGLIDGNDLHRTKKPR